VIALAAALSAMACAALWQGVELTRVGPGCGVGRMPPRLPRQRRRESTAVASALPLVCRTLAGELRAGAAPPLALSAAADIAPPALSQVLSRAARTAAVGGRPSAALRVEIAGGEGLRLLAACWDVTSDVGAGLAAACDQIAAALEADLRARRELDAALAGPRASAVVLACLPVVGLALGAGLGADPLGFLRTPPGLACLAGGMVLDAAGVAWTRRLAAGALQ
jgi:tight adherence protein B